MKRLLFLRAAPYFPATDLLLSEKYKTLSKRFSGDIIAVVHKKSYQDDQFDNFKVSGIYLPEAILYRGWMRNIGFFFYAAIKSLYNHYAVNKYDAIIVGEPFVAGILALIIGKITGAKKIVEINGNYNAAFISLPQGQRLSEKIKQKIVSYLIPIILPRFDGIKLLYQTQLRPFGSLNINGSIAVFHDFVPISRISPHEISKKYILFLGFPWYLKGVDILIKAFNIITEEYPEYRLKIVGYCPDKSYYKSLAANSPRIELCNPVKYEEAIRLMEQCAIFVLPSRTEAMGRVLLEAMAAKKPIIASDVDGIPTYIKDGVNGLLFKSEEVNDLAEKLRTFLSHPYLAEEMAEKGYEFVHNNLSETCYLIEYERYIYEILKHE